MQSFIDVEIARIKKMENPYHLFFRLTQIFCAVGVALQIAATVQVMYMGVSSAWFVFPLLFSIILAGAAEYGLRMCDKRHAHGVGVGIGLSLLQLFTPPIGALTGIFGIYCFMNSSFRESMGNRYPKWLENLVISLKSRI